MTLSILANQTHKGLRAWLYPPAGQKRGPLPASLLKNLSAAAACNTSVSVAFLAARKDEVAPKGQSRVAAFWDGIWVLQEQARAFQEKRLTADGWAQELDEYAAAVTWT